jgi:hypothetical protein
VLSVCAADPLKDHVVRAHESDALPPMTVPAIIQVGLFRGLAIGLRPAQNAD